MKRSMIPLLLLAFATNGSENNRNESENLGTNLLFRPTWYTNSRSNSAPTNQNNPNNNMMVPANNANNASNYNMRNVSLFNEKSHEKKEGPKVIGMQQEVLKRESTFYDNGDMDVKEHSRGMRINQMGNQQTYDKTREYTINRNAIKAKEKPQQLAIEIDAKESDMYCREIAAEKRLQCAGCKQRFRGSPKIIETCGTQCCLWKLQVHYGCFFDIVSKDGLCKCVWGINKEELRKKQTMGRNILGKCTFGKSDEWAKGPPENIYADLDTKKKFLVHWRRPVKRFQIICMAGLTLIVDGLTSYGILGTGVTETYKFSTIVAYVAMVVIGALIQLGVPTWMLVKYRMIVDLWFMEFNNIKWPLAAGLAVMILGVLIGGTAGLYFGAAFAPFTAFAFMGAENRSKLFLQLVYIVYMLGPFLQLIIYIAELVHHYNSNGDHDSNGEAEHIITALTQYGDSNGEAGHLTTYLRGAINNIIK